MGCMLRLWVKVVDQDVHSGGVGVWVGKYDDYDRCFCVA